VAPPQLQLLKEFAGQFCLRGQFADLEHRPAEVGPDAKVDKNSEPVAPRNFHALLPCRAAVYGRTHVRHSTAPRAPFARVREFLKVIVSGVSNPIATVRAPRLLLL